MAARCRARRISTGSRAGRAAGRRAVRLALHRAAGCSTRWPRSAIWSPRLVGGRGSWLRRAAGAVLGAAGGQRRCCCCTGWSPGSSGPGRQLTLVGAIWLRGVPVVLDLRPARGRTRQGADGMTLRLTIARRLVVPSVRDPRDAARLLLSLRLAARGAVAGAAAARRRADRSLLGAARRDDARPMPAMVAQHAAGPFALILGGVARSVMVIAHHLDRAGDGRRGRARADAALL